MAAADDTLKYPEPFFTKPYDSIDKEQTYKKQFENGCHHIISHGGLPYNKLLFTLPENVRLIQYTIPEKGIYTFEAYMIYKLGCTFLNDQIYLINKENGKLYQSRLSSHLTNPGEKTSDLVLSFNKNYSDLAIGNEFGIFKLNKISKVNHAEGTTVKLSNLIKYISEKEKKDGNTKVINIIQLSCMIKNPESELDEIQQKRKLHDEMIIKKTNTINDVFKLMKMNLIKNKLSYIKFLEKVLEQYYLVFNAEKANNLSKSIIEKINPKYYDLILRKNYNYKDLKQLSQGVPLETIKRNKELIKRKTQKQKRFFKNKTSKNFNKLLKEQIKRNIYKENPGIPEEEAERKSKIQADQYMRFKYSSMEYI
jgi:hypothetical protein